MTSTGDYILIANPKSRRVQLFQEALAGLNRPFARVLPWIEVLRGHPELSFNSTYRKIVRIESPGQDCNVERALLADGTEALPGYCEEVQMPLDEIAKALFERGRIYFPRQWFMGFCRALIKIGSRCTHARMVQNAGEIASMYDKPHCHALLKLSGVAVPEALSAVQSFSDLRDKMKSHSWQRVFIKLAYGSGASGIVAYETNGSRHRATSTVEMNSIDRELQLFNSRRLRVYDNIRDIEKLIDALCWRRVHVERWIPKAGINSRTFDLRVLTIAGRARHVVVRMSKGPMTNLHLLNERDTADAVRARMGDNAWKSAMNTCERAAACFPKSLHCGIDLLIRTDFRRNVVLEVNAFGDLLPGAVSDGNTTYTAEILAMDDKK